MKINRFIAISASSITLLLGSVYNAQAASHSAPGIGYTLHGTITDTYLSASVTGNASNRATAYVYGDVIRPSGSKRISTVSGSPYVSVNYRSQYKDAVKFSTGYFSCKVSGTSGTSFSLVNW